MFPEDLLWGVIEKRGGPPAGVPDGRGPVTDSRRAPLAAARLIGLETDPLAAVIGRATLAAAKIADRAVIQMAPSPLDCHPPM